MSEVHKADVANDINPFVLDIKQGTKAVEMIEVKGLSMSFIDGGQTINRKDPMIVNRAVYDKTPYVKVINNQFMACYDGLTSVKHAILLAYIVTNIGKDEDFIFIDHKYLTKINVPTSTAYKGLELLIANNTIARSKTRNKYWVNINRFRNGFSGDSITNYLNKR